MTNSSLRRIKIGNCGWSYLDCGPYFGPDWQEKFTSKLQAYAELFDLVEINSTFYHIPKLSTAEKWRREVNGINPKFEFTIKVSQLITHKNPFSRTAFSVFKKMKEIGHAINAKILLFQSPATFKPTKENIDLARKFFEKIDREKFILVWEVRWKNDWTKEIVKNLFSQLKINQCCDPLRQDLFYTNELVYYRLHGLGKPSIYNYSFSEKELKELARKIKDYRKPVYILFNNSNCYNNALSFKQMLDLKS